MSSYPTAFAKTQQLILSELLDRTSSAIRFSESLLQLSDEQLNARTAPTAWSVYECIAHLNDYADMYLATIEKRAASAPFRKKEAYKPGIIGAYLALAMHPNRRAKKIKSPAKTNHLGSVLSKEVLNTFLANLNRYQRVLEALHTKSIRGSRVPFSLTPIIRFHLGDLLACLVWHNSRHLEQAQEVIALSNVNAASNTSTLH